MKVFGVEIKRYGAAFTLIELLVVISIISLLMAIIIPIINRAREQGKRAVCLSNLNQLSLAWIMYADDNEDRIVCGDTEEYTSEYQPNGVHYKETAWVLKDWNTNDMAKKRDAIMKGALYRYARDVGVYKCPTGLRKELRLYTVIDAMNCIAIPGCGPGAVMIKNRLQIEKPYQRFVFLDDGGSGGATMGGWTCYVNVDRWWDVTPIRHGEGTTFSFADGHGEYWKWKDRRTLDFGQRMRAFSEVQTKNDDILRTQIGAWGEVALNRDE